VFLAQFQGDPSAGGYGGAGGAAGAVDEDDDGEQSRAHAAAVQNRSWLVSHVVHSSRSCFLTLFELMVQCEEHIQLTVWLQAWKHALKFTGAVDINGCCC